MVLSAIERLAAVTFLKDQIVALAAVTRAMDTLRRFRNESNLLSW